MTISFSLRGTRRATTPRPGTTAAFRRLLLRLSRMPRLVLFTPLDFDFSDLGAALPR